MRSHKWSGNFVCHSRIIQEETHLASSIVDALLGAVNHRIQQCIVITRSRGPQEWGREQNKLQDENKLLFSSSILVPFE
ncbi:Uncharacterized protein APZ42_007672 [Daphnia magna]|uniref:Uncharacterized protein n=1 Tax=Daphnia magna TaxID=35525 RepID=A0A164F5M3_9CRUS|nr:Uncharacterized protein APZ42_007672 [Daphnia magna]